MDHKTFLASLSPSDRETLTARSDIKGLLHLAGHWGAMILCAVLISAAVPFWQVILLLHGILLVFLFTLLHETCHKTPFKTGMINDVVGHVCGFLLFLPATWFRYFHFAHHRYTQVPGKDPELDAPKPKTWGQYMRHLSGVPIWISHAQTLIRNAMGRGRYDYVPEARGGEIAKEARLYLVGYAFLAGMSIWSASWVLIYIWLLPILIGQPFLRLYLLAEHGRCPEVVNMFENTRTTFTNHLVRFVAWNMPYHTEHHSYPSVPFHKLPELHRLAKPHLLSTSQGYISFNKGYVSKELE